MIELTLKAYLEERLGVSVFMERPAGTDTGFVLVQRTGSSETDQISRVTAALQSYGASFYEAAALNSRVKAAMKELPSLDCIVSARLASDYPFNDESRKEYRWQAVYTIVYYEEETE